MTALTWDDVGLRLFEAGVDRGVLYLQDANGAYPDGVAWNGLVTVTESPSGADSNPQYADNIKYLNLLSAEDFAATIEAFTYPDEFAQCDGSIQPTPGVYVAGQSRSKFGMAYRSKLGNDIAGVALGYKLHMLYGCQAAPSERAYGTLNDSPEAITFSWDISTTPVAVTDQPSPSALLVVDSTKVLAANLATLEGNLFGTAGSTPRLPLPDEVISILSGAVTVVDLGVAANEPTYDDATHIVTLPAVVGVTWKINGATKASGAQPALTAGQVAYISAVPQAGYTLKGDLDWVFDF